MTKKDQLDQEIESLAKSMEASAEDQHQLLLDVLSDMEPEEIKKSAEDMTPDEQEHLFKALQDLKKAASVPKSAETPLDPKMKVAKITDSVIEEDITNDDLDEKLVQDKNKNVKHQGDDSVLDGQVIKAKDMSDKECEQVADKEAKVEVKNHEEEMHKSDEIEEIEEVDEETNEISKAKTIMRNGERFYADGPNSGKKVGTVKGKRDAGKVTTQGHKDATKDTVESLKEQGASFKDQQSARRAAKQADKLKVKEVPKAEEAKPGVVEKSVVWKDDNHLLKANQLGRNHHFSVNDYYAQAIEALRKSQEAGTDLKKSEKVDINYIIAKGLDTNSAHIEELRKAEASAKIQTGSKTKSFDEAEIAKSLGLTVEDIETIFKK